MGLLDPALRSQESGPLDTVAEDGAKRAASMPRILQSTGVNTNISEQIYPVGAGDAAFHYPFKLVGVRVQFKLGSVTTTDFTIHKTEGGVSSGGDNSYALKAITGRGVGNDVNFLVDEAEFRDPSNWYFREGDSCSLEWTAPANVTWFMEALIQLV